MKTAFVCTLLLVGILLAGCSSGESYARTDFDFSTVDKVAVIDVEGQLNEAIRNQIGSFFVMELLKKGYAPIERAKVQALLSEQEFQSSDVTSSEGMAKAGRILNVNTVLLVNVPNFGDDISMTARMVDLEDGSILWMGSGSGKTGGMLVTLGAAAAGAVVGSTITDDSETGAIAGGVLGGLAGQAMAPQAAQKTKDIVIKICKSLPHKIPPPKPKGLF